MLFHYFGCIGDIQRYKVLQEVIGKRIKGVKAAEILKLTPVHISRLKARLLEDGFKEILRKRSALAPQRKIAQVLEDKIISLKRELYFGLL